MKELLECGALGKSELFFRKREVIAAKVELLAYTLGEESLDFIEKGASERLGVVRLRKVSQKIDR